MSELLEIMREAEDYLEHTPSCVRLRSIRQKCDCGLAEVQARYRAALERATDSADGEHHGT
jgi:hypothetical protein